MTIISLEKLTKKHLGKIITIHGLISSVRNHGKICFLTLWRNHLTLQLVIKFKENLKFQKFAFCKVTGTFILRSQKNKSKKIVNWLEKYELLVNNVNNIKINNNFTLPTFDFFQNNIQITDELSHD